MDAEEARAKVLAAADRLFYRRGIQAVGMDDIRTASGVSLKRLYQLFPAKERLVEEVLAERDGWFHAALAAHVERHEDPDERLLAVFDWLYLRSGRPGYRGCAFINSFGELGAASDGVARAVRAQKATFRAYLGRLVAAADRPAELADHLFLLAEGALTTAGITGSPEPARQARAAARVLLDNVRLDAGHDLHGTGAAAGREGGGSPL